MIHEHENNQDTESFLKSNSKKFQGDCLTVMKLLYQGIRLSSKDCWEKYSVHDRRLRNCFQARPDIVQREWETDGDGKRKYKEYFIVIPKQPTKSFLQEWWDEFQNEKPLTIPQQLSLYENQYRDA